MANTTVDTTAAVDGATGGAARDGATGGGGAADDGMDVGDMSEDGWSDPGARGGDAGSRSLTPRAASSIMNACADAATEYFSARDVDSERLLAAMRAAVSDIRSRPTGVVLESLRRRGSSLRRRSTSGLRRAVTGDASTRIRDHVRDRARSEMDDARAAARGLRDRAKSEMSELRGRARSELDDARAALERRAAGARARVQKARRKVERLKKKPAVIKTVDKVLFTAGVGWVAATEYVLLVEPARAGLWYVSSLVPALAYRVYSYGPQGYRYFCLDFCYALNALCVGVVLAGDAESARRVVPVAFALCNGPLLAAILVWRNSFIFHSLDHVTSTMLHALPPLWTYAARWRDASWADADLDAASTLLGAVAFYALWQALYILKTEVVSRAALEQNPAEFTSLRWIARDPKNATHRACKAALVRVGAMAADEAFDERAAKTKLAFWGFQLLYTLATLAPTPLLWRNRALHVAWIVAMFTTAVYNGASYYIEIFSKRYNNKFEACDDGSGGGSDDDEPATPGDDSPRAEPEARAGRPDADESPRRGPGDRPTARRKGK